MGPMAEILFAGWSVLTRRGTHVKYVAATRINHDWCRFNDPAAARFCARGLIAVQTGTLQSSVADSLLLEAITWSRKGNAVDQVVAWNNAPERTQAQVRDAFLRAAELAFKRGL